MAAVPPADNVTWPRIVAGVVALSENVTVPVGVPPGPVTDAVKVTFAPYTAVAVDCVRFVVEPAPDTICGRGADWEPPGKFASPR